MVYDGNTLSLYRDGQLMAQVPANGELFPGKPHYSHGFLYRAVQPLFFEG